jgi:membrane-bound metal-dependent hydrolase YbcI (DUF457 family)
MDIATHAMAGTIIALPFLPAAPWSATCFIFGSVLPDADTLSRMFGKIAFVRWHQTYTHSLPIIVITAGLLSIGVRWIGTDEGYAPLAFAVGMIGHVAMDATNTYGVALFAPFNGKRRCLEWLFFIDGVVVAISILCLPAVLIASRYARSNIAIAFSMGYGGFLVFYWLFRYVLHRRAVGFLPAELGRVIPSAMVPWRFLGYARAGDKVQLFEIEAIGGKRKDLGELRIFDAQYRSLLNDVVEYNLMKKLSAGYFAVNMVEDEGKMKLECRDLRIRNFGGEFGRLELWFDACGKLERKRFHV